MDKGRREDVMAVVARQRVQRGLAELLGGVALLKAVEVAGDLVATGAVDKVEAQRAVFEISSRLVISKQYMVVDKREMPSPAAIAEDAPLTPTLSPGGEGEEVTGREEEVIDQDGEEAAQGGKQRRGHYPRGDEADAEANLAIPLTDLKPHRCPVCNLPIYETSVGCLAHWRRVKRGLDIESAGK